MANKNPSPNTRFPKGVCQNPGGKPALPKHLKKVKEITGDELKRTIAMHFRMHKGQLAAVLQNPKTPTLDLIIASSIAKAIKDGDLHRAECLFMRCLGKVKDTLEVTQHDNPLKDLTTEQLLKIVQENKSE